MAIDTNEWTHNTTTARVNIPATTARAPGRKSQWTAEAGTGPCGGYFRAEGATERAAITHLSGIMAGFLAAYRTPEVFTYGGYTAVLSVAPPCEPGGKPSWTVQTVHADRRVSHSGTSGDTVAEARASIRRNLAHLGTDWHDDASVHAGAAYLDTDGVKSIGYGQYGPRDFYDYAAWQRAAKHAMDAGRADWHEWASTNRGWFALSHPDKPA